MHDFSSSISSSSKGSDKYNYNLYKAKISGSSNSKKSADLKSDSSSSKNRPRNALDIVEDDNEQYYQLLANFLKKQDNYGSEEPSQIVGSTYPIPISTVILSIIAWFLLSISIWSSKYVYTDINLTVWEDIYGRSLVGSIMSYLAMTVQDTSPFDIPNHIRTKLFFMQASFIIAFGLAMVGLNSLTALTSISILLMYFTFSGKIFGSGLIPVFGAIAGMIFLANPRAIFVEGVEQTIPVWCLGVAVLLIVLGKNLSKNIKQSLPLSTGKFLFNLCTLLIVPVFMIVAFSIESSNIDYGAFEMSYFLINGITTWTALYMIAQVFQKDKSNYLEVIGYSALIYIIVFQVFFYNVQSTTTSSESSTSTDPNVPPSEGTAPGPEIHQPNTLGAWEYAAISLMIGPRFILSIYRWFQYYKYRKDNEEDQSYSLVHIS